jgi:protein-disulfide isomerase/uncharacterized membrane protein
MSASRSNYPSRIAILMILGAAVSGWLLFHHVEVNGGFHVGPSICDLGGTFNCSEVARSSWSEVWGVPVASWGIWYYLSMVLAILLGRSRAVRGEEFVGALASVLWLGTLLALVSSLSLAALSIFSVGKVCLFCTLLYVINIIAAILAWKNPQRVGSQVNVATAVLRWLSLGGLRSALLVVLSVLVLGGVLAAPSILVARVFLPQQQARQSEQTLLPLYTQWQNAPLIEGLAELAPESRDSDYTKGSPNAELVLVEFSDFECPYCRRAAATIDGMLKQLGKEVRVVFKNFPIDYRCNDAIPEGRGHDFACRAAMMARCAGEQSPEKFWEMHDALFDLAAWSEDEMGILAGSLQLDEQRFAQCLSDPQVLEKIKKDVAIARTAGVRGTPSFFLNGKMVALQDLATLEPFLKFVLKRQDKN